MSGAVTGRRPMRSYLRVVMAALSVLVAVVGAIGVPFAAPGQPVARASVMATDANDYVPSVSSLPGFREEAVAAEGGDLDPTVSLRRSFVAVDGSRRVVVAVHVGTSAANAQTMLGDRVNQLIRYQGWQIAQTDTISDSGYIGGGPGPNGAPAAMMAFRIFAVMAEVTVSGPGNEPDVPLLDNVARLVAGRIRNEPDALAPFAGFPAEPQSLPGTDPVVIQIGAPTTGVIQPPGAEVTGDSSGSPIPADTIVSMTISAIDRPWPYTGSAPRPPDGMEYLTVDPSITVVGQTQVIIATTDFWISTHDGRSWSPVTGRSPSLPQGAIGFGTPVHGWLTFLVPMQQPALQLSWRLRTSQSLASQGDIDQTLVIPLTVGATAQAGVGTSAPPADRPVVPPSTGDPGGPAGPSGPSAPPTTDGGGNSGGGSSGGSSTGGGGRTPRGGGRLQ